MSSIGQLGGGQWVASHMPRVAEARQKLFNRVDADGSGGIDTTELQTALDKRAEKAGQPAADAKQVMQKADRDGNGTLDTQEVHRALHGQERSTLDFAQHRAEKVFSKLDADGNGALGADELNKLVDPMIQRAAGDTTVDETTKSETEAAVLQSIDGNGDGSISQDEFSALMKPADGSGTRPQGEHGHRLPLPALKALVATQYAQIAAGTGSTPPAPPPGSDPGTGPATDVNVATVA